MPAASNIAGDLTARVARSLPCARPLKLGVAVSGGSDSTALLYVLHDIACQQDIQLFVVSVDHGLRAQSAAEADQVHMQCRALNLPHNTLPWDGWDGQGNTQNEARQARYALMADWAHERGLDTIALGHTRDDQAETVMMRLARGAGVDGLSAMQKERRWLGITWIRPVLDVGRETLRAYLRAQARTWIEDPSNQDDHYDRIKVRNALKTLNPIGLDVDTLAQVAENLSQARAALDHYTHIEARRLIEIRAGAVTLDWTAFNVLPLEISRRILVQSLCWVGNTGYAPRRASVAALRTAVGGGHDRTLLGCQIRLHGESLWISREYNAVKNQIGPVGDLWDGRWQMRVNGPQTGLTVAALGNEGLQKRPEWRDCGLPREVLRASPAIWRDGHLMSAPLLDGDTNFAADLIAGENVLFAALLTH